MFAPELSRYRERAPSYTPAEVHGKHLDFAEIIAANSHG
jgi:hypothetical protein